MTADDVGGRRPSEYHYGSSRFKNDLPSPEEVGTKAAERTLALMGSKKIPTLTIPVIIENREAARVLYGLITPLMGSSIQQKMSFLADKKGKQIGSRFLTLSNDPLLPRGLGSRYYDYDNFSARKQTLFTEGTLNDFLIDWYYSRKLKCEPTSGTISNMIIPPGRRSVQEIIKDLGRCLLITGFIGGNSNSTTGDFSAGINGKLFDKGAFVQNVAEMNIAGNHLNFWNRLVEVANDPWIYSSAIFPSLVIDQVVVSGI
jgi:PmbA protein